MDLFPFNVDVDLVGGLGALALQESTVQRDFTWLLRVMSEMAPSEGGGLAGTLSYDGIWTPDPRSLQGKLGILVPETVILEKGKPKRCAAEAT